MDVKILNQLLSEIEHLKQAKKLLEAVWFHIDVYDCQVFSEEILRELKKFFLFDDSE